MSSTGTASNKSTYSPGAVGFAVFASVMLIIGGTMQALQGLVALVNDTFYVVGQEYLFKFDVTSWGWIHLILGIVVAGAGFALLQGATWARVVAVIVASVSIIANFVWMPYYPLWSLTVIALNVAVIWAVTMHGRDVLGE
ncbi:MAG TPA: hypothetical protein VES02_06335 [Dermatophilaceae bacterium]|nr:hypothetical protein [Dermatophilaceae bacterium]